MSPRVEQLPVIDARPLQPRRQQSTTVCMSAQMCGVFTGDEERKGIEVRQRHIPGQARCLAEASILRHGFDYREVSGTG